MKPSPRDLLLARAHEAAPDLDAQRQRIVSELRPKNQANFTRLLVEECFAPWRRLWAALGTLSIAALVVIVLQSRTTPSPSGPLLPREAWREWASGRALGAVLAAETPPSSQPSTSPSPSRPLSLRPCSPKNAA